MKWKSNLWRLFIGVFLLTFYSIAFSLPKQTLSTATQYLTDAAADIKSGKRITQDELNSINETAKTRQTLFADELNQGKPVTQYVLSKQILDLLPRETRPYLEYEVGPLTGKLEVRAADYKNNQSVIEYLLVSGDEKYYLHFTDGAPDVFETDSTVTVHRAMNITRKGNISHIVLSHQNLTIKHFKPALPLSLGPQRTLTILVNFSDRPSDRPWTQAQINTLMYTTINNHFQESSYRQTSLVGRTAGWYVINVNSGADCNTITSEVERLGNQAATNDGITLSQYNRRVYIFPDTQSCGWAGLGNIGGTITRSWVNGAAGSMRTPAHELGHNFGIYHSKLLTCSGSPNSGSCSRSEYGDGTDIMGAARTSHFNAYQKDRLGWLNYQASPPITTVTTSGTYSIDPFETTTQKPKALRILKRAGTSDYYYLEYRQGIGFDAELASCGAACDYTRGVVFHQGNTNNGNTSDLLDMSPGTSNRLVALLPGQRWTDVNAPNGGVTFQVVSANSVEAVVNVTYGSTPPPPPTDTRLDNGVPISNLSGARGSERYYYIDVPAGKSSLQVQISGGTGDCDLYVQFGQRPTTTQYQCRPYRSDNNETCTFNSPQAGKYYVMLRGYDAYSGVTLVARH